MSKFCQNFAVSRKISAFCPPTFSIYMTCDTDVGERFPFLSYLLPSFCLSSPQPFGFSFPLETEFAVLPPGKFLKSLYVAPGEFIRYHIKLPTMQSHDDDGGIFLTEITGYLYRR